MLKYFFLSLSFSVYYTVHHKLNRQVMFAVFCAVSIICFHFMSSFLSYCYYCCSYFFLFVLFPNNNTMMIEFRLACSIHQSITYISFFFLSQSLPSLTFASSNIGFHVLFEFFLQSHLDFAFSIFNVANILLSMEY